MTSEFYWVNKAPHKMSGRDRASGDLCSLAHDRSLSALGSAPEDSSIYLILLKLRAPLAARLSLRSADGNQISAVIATRLIFHPNRLPLARNAIAPPSLRKLNSSLIIVLLFRACCLGRQLSICK